MECSRCYAVCEKNDRFCHQCGQSLFQKATVPIDVSRVASVLYADVQGSTELVSTLDPEDAKSVLAPTIGTMQKAVYDHRGKVIHTLGDGLIAAFGIPEEQEDHALRACQAGFQMVTALKEASGYLKIRVGIHSGPITLTIVGDQRHHEYDISGPVANIASYMEKTAEALTVQITKATYDFVHKSILFAPKGKFKLGDFESESFQILGFPPKK